MNSADVNISGLPANTPSDPIPLEGEFHCAGPAADGQCSAQFFAFNTVITLQAYADKAVCEDAFAATRERCRFFERAFSRTLPHSDIARLNAASGAWVEVTRETFELLRASQRYCAESGGVFDITMGAAVRLWDFHHGIIPEAEALKEALAHVNWKALELRKHGGSSVEERGEAAGCANSTPLGAGESREAHRVSRPTHHEARPTQKAPYPGSDKAPRYFARLTDPLASIDVGGTAKGFIADELGALFEARGIASFVVNLGGNVLARGRKPSGDAWRIGLQDPRTKRESEDAPALVGAVALTDAAVVTSGVNERSFTKDGVLHHHILSTETGFPVTTDVAAVTVVAERAMDAEGYSTTLLALGHEKGAAFVHEHPAIAAAFFIDEQGEVSVVSRSSALGNHT